ncbi:hypothetical protein FZEAL_60 [Fusarium zealandicum]|uniref:Uncharacterized protein n=1 Tax=Fusarium zealandicum TaxID=1053134 RepID=A0A8H4UW49_9HYPO|nr:hypothetical protein FZEAL_60 [Fusarium zealandicum]
MLSLEYHVLFWALSLLTLPCFYLHMHLTYVYGILPEFLDEPMHAIMGLTIYVLLHLYPLPATLPVSGEDRPGNDKEQNGYATQPKPTPSKQQNGNVLDSETEPPKSNGKPTRGNGTTKKHKGRNRKPRENGTCLEDKTKATKHQNGDANECHTNGDLQEAKSKAPISLPPGTGLRRVRRSRGLMGRFGRWLRPHLNQFCLLVNKYHSAWYYGSILPLCTYATSFLGIDSCHGDKWHQMAAMTLASFQVLATLEPMRRDRWDMQSCGLEMFRYCCPMCSTGLKALESAMMGLVGLAGTTMVLEVGVYLRLGFWISLPSWWFPGHLTLPQLFVHVWLLSPLIDVAETITYTIARTAYPKWYRDRLEHIQRPI